MEDAQNSGFIRQRRNLMIISLVLLFSEVTELKIEKLSAFGTELKIGEPQAVNWALWVAGVYWLWRFYQYSRPIFKGTIQGAIYQRTQETSLPVVLKKVLRENPNFLERLEDVPAEPTISIKESSFWGQGRDYLEVQISLYKEAVSPRATATQSLGDHKIRLTGSDLRPLRRRAWFYLIVHTTLFTDLILPYVLFGLPVVYAGYIAVRPHL